VSSHGSEVSGQIANGSKNPDDARIKDLENLTLILTKAHHNALLRAPWILLDVLQDFFLYWAQ